MIAESPVTIEVRGCTEPTEVVRAQLEQRIRMAMAGTPIDKVAPAVVPCLWRIQAKNGAVMYADWSGRYLIQGAVIDLKTGQMLETKTTRIANE